jgi:PAS domain S-box-containing protein
VDGGRSARHVPAHGLLRRRQHHGLAARAARGGDRRRQHPHLSHDLGGALAVVLFWGRVQAPYTLTLFCLGIVVVMAYALSTDLLRAKQLVIELSEKEQQAALAAEAANLGTFTRDIPRDVIEASDEWRELFGFAPDEPLSMGSLLQKIHVDDRAAFGESTARAIRDRGEQHVEFRLPLADGRMRWIAAIGRIEFDSRSRPLRSRGACIDITSRKLAEQEMLRLR